MNKIVLFILMLIAVCSNAYAEDGTKKFWDVDEKIIAQFEGIVIDGKTAVQAHSEIKNKTRDGLIKEYEDLLAATEEARKAFNSLWYKENAMRDISEQRPVIYKVSDPYDFIDLGYCVVHWLTVDYKILTCSHKTRSEMQKHAQVFIEMNTAWEDYNKKKHKLENVNSLEHINKVFRTEIPKFLPPYYEQKIINMTPEVEKVNASIKRITCSASIQQYPFRCKGLKKCKMTPVINSEGIIEIGCACGHSLELHTIKYNKNTN